MAGLNAAKLDVVPIGIEIEIEIDKFGLRA
jgi:hypothetical protein